MSSYFLMYLLTLFVDLNFTWYYIAVLLVGGISLVLLPVLLEEDFESLHKAVKAFLKPFLIVSLLLVFVDWLSPTKEEAIFIAVAGMAIDGEVHTKTIDILGEALDLSEEYIIKIKEDLQEETTPKSEEGGELL